MDRRRGNWCTPGTRKECGITWKALSRERWVETPAMTGTYITSRQLDRTPGRAKRATRTGPVFITEHGKVQFVILSIEEYEYLNGRPEALANATEARSCLETKSE